MDKRVRQDMCGCVCVWGGGMVKACYISGWLERKGFYMQKETHPHKYSTNNQSTRTLVRYQYNIIDCGCSRCILRSSITSQKNPHETVASAATSASFMEDTGTNVITNILQLLNRNNFHAVRFRRVSRNKEGQRTGLGRSKVRRRDQG